MNCVFMMDDTLTTYSYRDTACSARSLATLLVAWVCAAMVASILLRWSYMWIALAILTLIFLLACGYAACSTKRLRENYLAREEARHLECRRQQQCNIETVAARIDNNYFAEPPRYQAYWINDLPPPYSSPMNEEIHRVTGEAMPSNPPPYSIAIQTNRISRQMQRTTTNRTGRIYRSQSYSPPRTCDKKTNKLSLTDNLPPCIPNIINISTIYSNSHASQTINEPSNSEQNRL